MESQQQPQGESSEEEVSPKGISPTPPWSPAELKVDLRKAIAGGAIAAIVSAAGSWVVGSVHGSQGLVLLEAMLPTTRFLCSSVMTASATVLALMLTLLGLSTGSSDRFKASHYQRVQQIALIVAIAFVAATVFLLVLNIPLEESDNIAAAWYSTAYYVVLVASSLLGGLLVAAILMLYDAVRDMIQIVGIDG